jgi:HPt (histidine-containing phosphotransfer) domain-containing protein
MTQDPGTPCIDPKVLSKLYELQDEADPHLVADLIRMLFSSAPLRISRIVEAIGTGNARVIERESHDLKSSAANLGALRMAGLAAQLEQNARTGDLAAIPALVEGVKREFELVRGELEKSLEKR